MKKIIVLALAAALLVSGNVFAAEEETTTSEETVVTSVEEETTTDEETAATEEETAADEEETTTEETAADEEKATTEEETATDEEEATTEEETAGEEEATEDEETVVADEEKAVVVNIDGVALEIADQQPIIEGDRVLVPLRAIFEALDAEVEWDQETKTVTAVKGENTIELTIGETAYTVNDEAKEMDVPAQLVNDRTLIPIRVVSESLACEVEWDGEGYIVDVSTPEHLAVVAEADRIRAIEPDIDEAYKTVDDVRLPIKMYLSEDEVNGKTAILAIHGGSWYAVKEDSDTWNGSWMNYQAQYYADKGYTTAAISYRSIDFNEETTVFDLIQDCKDAVAYMREKADFDKLVVMGDSSGAHLAVELGLDDEVGVDIVVAANPVLDLTEEAWKHTAKTEEDYEKASPAFNIKKTDTKFLVMHGNADTVVNYEISKKFCEDMTAAGTQADFIELDGVEHAFLLSRYKSTDEQINEYMAMIDEYLAENL